MKRKDASVTGRLLIASLAFAALAALGASSSAAALQLPGAATACAPQALSRPFLPWLDFAYYTMPSGGSFENSADGWSLEDGTEIATGNEPYKVGGDFDSMSLRLPPGSSAVSSPICIGLGHLTMRFFAKKSSGLLSGLISKKRLELSTLRVDVRYQDSSGATRSLPVGVVTGSEAWRPTLPIPVVANLLTLLPNGQTHVVFAFTPTGGAEWRIDDVYVDPYRRS